MSESNVVRCTFVGLTGATCDSAPQFHIGYNHPFTTTAPAEQKQRGVLVCVMCDAPAVCLSVPGDLTEGAMFACGECCGCAGCANVHDAENPYCEAETGGCWRLVAIPEYVSSLRDDLNALDETTASRINELEQQLARLAGPVCDYPPCQGARAIEHYQGGSDDCMETRYSGSGKPCGFPNEWWIHDLHSDAGDTHVFVPNDHPPVPAIEGWIRERATTKETT